MKKIKGSIILFFCFPFFLFAQEEVQLFQSLSDYKMGKSTPADQIFIEKRKEKEIKKYGGSDYKVYASNKRLSSMLETYYWGVLKEDSLFVNCKQLSIANGYAYTEQIGNNLFLMLPDNAKYNTSGDGDTFAVTSSNEDEIRYIYYIMDFMTGKTKPLTNNRMIELLSFHAELVEQYLNELDPRNANTQRKYLIASQLGTKAVQELIAHNDTAVKTSVNIQNQFTCMVKFKPLATVIGAILGVFDFEIAIVPYLHPKIGVPVELQVGFVNKTTGIALMTGIEAVPVTHREKSGLYLNYELGGIYITTGNLGFCTATHIGYQLVTKKGLVFTPAVGLQYETTSNTVGLHFMLDIGFAFKGK